VESRSPLGKIQIGEKEREQDIWRQCARERERKRESKIYRDRQQGNTRVMDGQNN
jgi:hypothetical protein